MNPYVCLIKLGQHATEGSFIERFEGLVKKLNGNVEHAYGTLGRYDFVAFLELPTPAAAAEIAANVQSWGVQSIETLAAIPTETVDQLMAKVWSQGASTRTQQAAQAAR